MLVQGTDQSVTVRADVAGISAAPGPFQNLALGIVLTSLSRGWSANLDDTQKDYPYNAYVYLVQAFISAAQGGTSLLTVAPAWYWYLLDAIAPTTVKWKTGAVDCSWSFPQVASYVPPSQVLSNGNLQVYLGWVNTSVADVNGFYPIVPGVYDATIADKAIQSLFTLYPEDGPMLKRVPRRDTMLRLDVSAFTTAYPEFGGAIDSPGGLATSLQSEIFINCPILAKFGYYNDNVYRGVTHTGRSSGTPCYIIPRMLEMTDENQLKNKVPPVFKFYNFDEFYEVLALTLARAMEITATNNAQQPVASCPLSPQAMQILLRQSIITRFCNHMAQDINLEGPVIVTSRVFSVGANGLSVTMPSIPLKLPQLLAENIRAVDRRLTFLANRTHQSDIIPILYRPTFAQLGNYTTKDGTPVFTDVPGEVPIDLVSMSAVTNAGLTFLDANGPYIASLAVAFNEWITTLGAALSPLTNHADEDGIRVLSTIVNTLHCTRLEPPPENLLSKGPAKSLTKRPSVVSLGKKIELTPRVGVGAAPLDPDTYTKFIGPVAFTSTYRPKTPIYKYLRIMILPTVILEGDNAQDNIFVQQVNQIEPSRINDVATSDQYRSTGAPTLLERHLLMAEQDVRVNLAMPTEFQQELDELTRKGRGGFLTDLAGLVGEAFHIPGAREIAAAVGSLTGL